MGMPSRRTNNFPESGRGLVSVYSDMSSSQCCYVRQNTLPVLTQCVFKVSAFGYCTHENLCAPLSDCCINNALIRVTSSK